MTRGTTSAIVTPAKKGKPGPQPRGINLAVVTGCARVGCTHEEIAVACGVSRRIFFDRLSDDPRIQAAIDLGRETGKKLLRQAQWRAALKGDRTMLIWLGKNILGQRDHTEHTLGLTKSLEDLLREMHARRKAIAAQPTP
jgi:hypothetical protein